MSAERASGTLSPMTEMIPEPTVNAEAAPVEPPATIEGSVPSPAVEQTEQPSIVDEPPTVEPETAAPEPEQADEPQVLVKLEDDADGNAVRLGNHFVGLSPVHIPADMLDRFKAEAERLGRKIVEVL